MFAGEPIQPQGAALAVRTSLAHAHQLRTIASQVDGFHPWLSARLGAVLVVQLNAKGNVQRNGSQRGQQLRQPLILAGGKR